MSELEKSANASSLKRGDDGSEVESSMSKKGGVERCTDVVEEMKSKSDDMDTNGSEKKKDDEMETSKSNKGNGSDELRPKRKKKHRAVVVDGVSVLMDMLASSQADAYTKLQNENGLESGDNEDTSKKRNRKNRTVVIDGVPVLMDTLTSSQKDMYKSLQKDFNSSNHSKNISDEPKMSKRKRKQRTVMVDGHSVLMDSLSSSEKEFYVKLQNESKRKKMQKALSHKNNLTKKTVLRSEAEIKRLESNASMRSEHITRQKKMYDFFYTLMKNELKPFIEKKTLSTIRDSCSSTSPSRPERPDVEAPSIRQPTCILNGTLRSYQLGGLEWLMYMYDNGMSPILGDEMGLGKTLQTISFLAMLKESRNVGGPHLVIVPLSVMSSWMNEFRKWCPSLRVVRVHSSDKRERERIRKTLLSDLDTFDVVVTTYDYLTAKDMKSTLISRIHWRVVVFDEGHKLKNPEAQLTCAARNIKSQCILLLTGTPLQNNLTELYALLNLLYPTVFKNSAPFDDAFQLKSRGPKIDRDILDQAHYLLRPLMLRRLKSEVETKLPPRRETKVVCPLATIQRRLYCQILRKDKDLILDAAAALANDMDESKTSQSNKKFSRLRNLMMQLRKCCCHPFLFPAAEEAIRKENLKNGSKGWDGTCDETIVTTSGKMIMLDRLLSRLKLKGHRVVIFSQFTRVLDIIDDYLNMRGYKFARLDGSTNRVQRMIHIHEFNKDDSLYFAMIMSTRAGGMGINLQTADTVILMDSDWNPQSDLQAMARVHRIGQKKTVHVYRLISKGTMEERMVQRAQKKLFLDTMVNRGSTKTGEEMDKIDTSEMLKMLSFGMNAMFTPKNSDGEDMSQSFTDAQIDRLIDRKHTGIHFETFGRDDDEEEEKEDEVNGIDNNSETKREQLSKHLEQFDENQDLVSMTEFEGQEYRNKDHYHKKRKNQFQTINTNAILHNTKRKRKNRVVMVDGFKVLKSNMYNLEDGEPSVMDTELQSEKSKPKVSSSFFVPMAGREMAGRDYDYQSKCIVCFRNVSSDDLSGRRCWQCPVVCHQDCVNKLSNTSSNHVTKKWGCSHHQCCVCNRKAAAAGGLLFRCEMCPKAWCDDDLPNYARDHITNRCERYLELGMKHPKTACFVLCSRACVERWDRTDKGRLSDDEDATESEEEDGDEMEQKGGDISKKKIKKMINEKKNKMGNVSKRRSDWERLRMATSLSNNAVQWSLGLAMATTSQGIPLRRIPGFENRLMNATDFAATRLHAILYNGREAQKDLRQEILEWRGASQDSLPSLYLRLVRWFEATGNTRWSKDQLVRLLNMLGLRNNVNRKFTSLRVSQICEILSLALAFPSYSHTFQVTQYLIEEETADYVAENKQKEEKEDLGDGMIIAAAAFSPQPKKIRPDVEEIKLYVFPSSSVNSNQNSDKIIPMISQFQSAIKAELRTSGMVSKSSLAKQLNISAINLGRWFAGDSSVAALSSGEIACKWYVVESRRNQEENLNRWRNEILKLKSRTSKLLNQEAQYNDIQFQAKRYQDSLSDPKSKRFNQLKNKFQNAGQRHIRLSVKAMRRKDAVARMEQNAKRWVKYATKSTRFRVLSQSSIRRTIRKLVPELTKLKLSLDEDAEPGQMMNFVYRNKQYECRVPDNHVKGNKTVDVEIKVYVEKDVEITQEIKSGPRRRGIQKDSMWHCLKPEEISTETDENPYFLGHKIRRFFFNNDENGTFVKYDGIVTGVRLIPVASSSSHLDILLQNHVVDLSSWKVKDVSKWLQEKSLNNHKRLEDIVRIFQEHSIDGDLLATVTFKDLRLMGLHELLDLSTRRRLLFAIFRLRGLVPRWRVKYKDLEEFDLDELEIRRSILDNDSEEGWISQGDEFLNCLGMTKNGEVGVFTGVWCPTKDDLKTYLPLYRLTFGIRRLDKDDDARDDDGLDMELFEVQEAFRRANRSEEEKENAEKKEETVDDDEDEIDEMQFYEAKDFKDILECVKSGGDVAAMFKKRDGYDVVNNSTVHSTKVMHFPAEGLLLKNKTALLNWLETHIEMVPTANGVKEARLQMHEKALRRMFKTILKNTEEYESQRAHLILALDETLASSRRLVRSNGWTKRVSSLNEILYLDRTGLICCRSLTSALDTMLRSKELEKEIVSFVEDSSDKKKLAASSSGDDLVGGDVNQK